MEPRLGSAGFTLVELMVVVAILAVLTLSVTMGINRPRSPDSQDWSRFARLHDRLREQAVMGQETLGLRIGPEGYRRQVRTAEGWQDQGPAGTWVRGVRVERPFRGVADVVAFLPGGRSTPVRVVFAGPDAAGPETICESDGWERVSCAAR